MSSISLCNAAASSSSFSRCLASICIFLTSSFDIPTVLIVTAAREDGRDDIADSTYVTVRLADIVWDALADLCS